MTVTLIQYSVPAGEAGKALGGLVRRGPARLAGRPRRGKGRRRPGAARRAASRVAGGVAREVMGAALAGAVACLWSRLVR